MHSKKVLFLSLILLALVVVPCIPSQNAYSIIEIGEKSTSYQTEIDSSMIKRQPPVGQDYDLIFIESSSIEYAKSVEWHTWDNFKPTANPTSRFHDMSRIQMALGYIDLFYTTNETFFINEAKFHLQNLYLDVNGSYIRGKNTGTNQYELHAADNFLLVIAYARLAEALQVNGDTDTTLYRNLANTTFSNLLDIFYFPTTGTINSTLFLDEITLWIEGASIFASAKATGLFSIANYLLNDNTLFYSQTKTAVDTYIANGNRSALGSGALFQTTLGSGAASDNEADIQGNVYMSTAILQHSTYQKRIAANNTASLEYYGLADLVENTIFDAFYSTTTNLLHSRYDLNAFTLSPDALTYENCMVISQVIEFQRKRFEDFNILPSVFRYLDLLSTLIDLVFDAPLAFEAGFSEIGTIIFNKWDVLYENPIMVNFQAVTMFTKLFPILTYLVSPHDIPLFQLTSFDLYLEFAETTSIYQSSASILPYNFEYNIFSQSNLNVSYATHIQIKTTALNGIRNRTYYLKQLFFQSELGGNHEITLDFYHALLPISDFTYYFYIDKEIRIETDPLDITVTQGVKNEISFTIKCVDEQGLSVKNAAVEIRIDLGGLPSPIVIPPTQTDNAGNVDINIDLLEILNGINVPQEVSEIGIPIIINASKIGYLSTELSKEVTIYLNPLIVEIDPSPLEIKELSDLNLYIDVKTQIPASIIDPSANIFLGDELIEEDFDLPASLTIESADLKTGNTTLIVAVSDTNFGNFIFRQVFEINVIPLRTLEKVYTWIEQALQSTAVQVIGSLGILWALLWKQFNLLIIGRYVRCHYCGETTKKKFALCKNCGHVLRPEKLPSEAKSDPPDFPAPKPPEPQLPEQKPPEPRLSEFKPSEPEKKDDAYSNYSNQY
ncbi:MAG: hypothetical protein HGN29_08685 [Asgard group archaeon]|nr:hypothetical protein [Asgard group archaeon]